MNCTKCGKEIPDGETKICEECQKKILDEIVQAEKEEKAEKTEKEEKFKVVKDKEKTKKSIILPIIITLVILVVICLGGIIYVFTYTGNNEFINSVKTSLNLSTTGNTIGNIRNYGYAAKSGKWIYFLAPNEDSSQVGIFRVKEDGTGKQELFMNTNEEGEDTQKEIVSINAYGNYVYFIGIESKAYSEEDEVDNKIYRMKADGSSDLEVINDNEFNNECYEIYIVNGYIYYIDVEANVARMNLDGSKKSVVTKNGTGYLGITEKYIIYNNPKKDNTEEYETYIMGINGENPRPILEGKRLYSVNIEDDYVYYTNDDKKIYRTKIDSNQEELVYDAEAYNLNVYNGYAYYLNYKDSANEDYTVCIYKVTLDPAYDGKKAEVLKELETYSSFLNVIDEWALYMDSNETNGYINLLKTDGSEDTVQLYLLDYEKYYERIDTTTAEEQPTEGEPTTETTEDTNVVAQDNTNEVSTNTVQNTTNNKEN